MPETLLTPSSIKLYGRVMTDLQFTNDTSPFGGNYFLQRQLAASGTISLTASTTIRLTTVTVASLSGLAAGQGISGDPLIIPAGATIAGFGAARNTFDLSVPALATSPSTPIIVNTGPAGDKALTYWEYEKGDFSIRLDMEAGPFEQILLMAALRAGADMADRATGIRSGASLAGASLSGASLSGASLSGASLSGASLSGASLRR